MCLFVPGRQLEVFPPRLQISFAGRRGVGGGRRRLLGGCRMGRSGRGMDMRYMRRIWGVRSGRHREGDGAQGRPCCGLVV